MTRKHFNAIAAVLNHEFNNPCNDADTVMTIIHGMAIVLNAFNCNFDHARFVDACTKKDEDK